MILHTTKKNTHMTNPTTNPILTAVFYTGIVDDKTFLRCLDTLCENVLHHHRNQTAVVFAVLSSNEREKHEGILRSRLAKQNSVIGSIEWVDHSTEAFQSVKRETLQILETCIQNGNCEYFEKSDALLEYYRIFVAYQTMVRYEYKNRMRFDFITRTRPDAIFVSGIEYPPHDLSEDKIRECVAYIREHTKYTKNHEVVALLMNGLFIPGRFTDSSDVDFLTHSLVDMDHVVDLDDPKSIVDYVQTGKYVITIGKNLLFITRRHHFTLLPTLGVTYGMYFLSSIKQWLDPPSQFQICALLDRYAIFDSITKAEAETTRDFVPSKVSKELGCVFIAS